VKEQGFRDNAATITGQRVIAALEAHDFDTLATLFADDYVEVLQRNADTPIPRDDMLSGIRALVEGAGGGLEIDPIATRGERLQLHHTRITVPKRDGEADVIEYMSVMVADADGRLRRTEAFEVDRLDDATARLEELYRAGE
jgi:hypothetical protein